MKPEVSGQSSCPLYTRRFLPDKAIDLIDEAASRVRIKHWTVPIALKDERLKEDNLRKSKDEALSTQKYELAAELRSQELQAEDKIKNWKKTGKPNWRKKTGSYR